MLDRTIPPKVSPYGSLSIPFPTERTLANGIKYNELNHGDQPMNKITLTWNVGTGDVTNGDALHLAARLLREDTTSFSGEMISETLDFNGAWLKVLAADHYVNLNLYSLNKSTLQLLDLLGEIITKPLFKSDIVKVITNRVASQLEVNEKKVAYVAERDSKPLIYGKNHPLAKAPTPEGIRSLTPENLFEAFNQAIATTIPTAYFAGMTADLSPAIVKFLESIDTSRMSVKNANIIPFEPVAETVTTDIGAGKQAAVKMTIPTINRDHPDYIKLRIAVTALGGYFGSRLMKNIREEKGLTYGISASLFGHREGAYVGINSQTDVAYIDRLISEVRAEIDGMKTNPMYPAELHAVKSTVLSSLASMLDSPFTIIDHHILNRHLCIPDDYFNRQLAAIQSLTAEEAADIFARHVNPENLAINIVK